MLRRYCGTESPVTPEPVLQWLRSHLPEARKQIEPPRLHLDQDGSRLTFRLHRRLDEEDARTTARMANG